MTSSQEDIQVPITHIGHRHLAKTFNGSHPAVIIECFCRTANPKRVKKFRMSETLPDI